MWKKQTTPILCLSNFVFIPVDRHEIVLWTTLGYDFKVEHLSSRGSCAGTYTREDHLVDVTNFNQGRYFGDRKDITFMEEEIASNGFEIGFENWVSVSARRGL